MHAPKLTQLERETLDLLVGGLSSKEISQRCGKALSTTKNRLSTIYEKIGVQDRAGAAVWWATGGGGAHEHTALLAISRGGGAMRTWLELQAIDVPEDARMLPSVVAKAALARYVDAAGGGG